MHRGRLVCPVPPIPLGNGALRAFFISEREIMEVKKIAALLTIAGLAIDHQNAKIATAKAKLAYHMAWRRHETGDDYHPVDEDFYVHPSEWIGRNSKGFDEACAATSKEYKEYSNCKRQEYNVKRRLETAVRKVI